MPEILSGFDRVTTILGQWDRFGGIPFDVRERSMERGSHVHEQIDLWAKGLSTSQDPMLHSYQTWIAESDAMILRTEERFYDEKLRITGCIDAIVDLDNEIMIVDYKTSQAEDKKLWPLQGTFYYLLARPHIIKLSSKVLFLKLDREGGTPTAYIYEITDRLINVAMSALNCYRYLHG